MLARAIALASVVADDETPLARLPAPFADEAREARARLLGAARLGRGAAIARETLALFGVAPVPGVRRRLTRGLAIACAPDDAPVAPAAPPSDLVRALGAAERLGLTALERALVDVEGASLAEIVRHLEADQAARVLQARRRAVDPETVQAARLVLDAVLVDRPGGSLARTVGLARIAWAAAVEPGALQALASILDDVQATAFVELGARTWFAAAEHAAAERARIGRDLGGDA